MKPKRDLFELLIVLQDGSRLTWKRFHESIYAAMDHCKATLAIEYPDGKGGSTARLLCTSNLTQNYS